MGPLFAKMDINLDSHPKIRKAGRDGREVFLFVLRKNAALGRGGKIPASYVDPTYLAEQLMVTVSEARSGLSRCVTADLLFVTPLEVEISGWDDDWGGRALTPAERKAKQRSKSRKSDTSDTESRDVTIGHVDDRDDRDSHAVEKRREEKIERGTAAPLSLVLTPEPQKPEPAPAKEPRSAPRRPLDPAWTPPRSETILEAERQAAARGVDVSTELAQMRDWAVANAAKKADWPATWRGWLRRARAQMPTNAQRGEIRGHLRPM
jgi:hypothetical protein